MANSPPYAPDEALSMARRCLEESTYRLTYHVIHESGEARDFDDQDCFYVIERSGVIDEEPEYSSKYDNWVYKITGTDIEERPLTLVIAIGERNGKYLIIITGYR